METSNINQRKYTPVNGVFYEHLETAAMHNENCEIVYIDDDGNEHNISSRIDDLYTHDHVEYAVLENHTTIRLDQIKSLNGEVEPHFKERPQDFEEEFRVSYYSSKGPVLAGQNDYYQLSVDRIENVIELKVVKSWDSMDDIPELKTQLVRLADYLHDTFGMLIDYTAVFPNNEGTLESPFIPARGILINAGLVKVADLIPENCNTVVHNRGSFSVNSLKVRSFKDRYFAWNWLTER